VIKPGFPGMKKMRHFFLLFCSSGDEGERGGENVRVGIVEGEIRRLWVRVAVIVLTARAVCVVVEKEEIGCRESREVGFCWWGKGDPNPGSGIRGSDSFCKNLGYCPNDLTEQLVLVADYQCWVSWRWVRVSGVARWNLQRKTRHSLPSEAENWHTFDVL